MKKLVVGMLACTAMIAASTISFGTTGKVNTDTVRVRSEATASSTIVELLSINDKVEVVEETGDWYKVKIGNDKTGYVSKKLLDVEEPVTKTEEKTAEPAEQKAETEESKTESAPAAEEAKPEEKTENAENTEKVAESKIKESYTGKVTSEIAIKILPSINSMNVTKLPKDTEIKVIEVINDWCHIETSTYSGWARIAAVEKAVEDVAAATAETAAESATTEETTEKEPEFKTGYVNVETVNVRKEKSTTSEKIKSLEKNTEVTILAEEDGWYKVKVKDVTGYISKKYLSSKKVEETTSRAADTARQLAEAKESSAETAAAPAPSGSKGADVVAFAKQYLGSRYVAGGSSPSGFDCSGFTSYVYSNFGVSLSRTSSGQRSNGVAVDKSNLQQGDILCFSGHVGLYIGNNQFIHASNPRGGVKISSLSESYYVKNYITARRVLD